MTTMHGTNERAGGATALGSAAHLRWARSPNVLDRPTRQGVMVLPPEGAAVLLTGLAARVWEALAQPLGGDQLVARLGGPAASGVPGVPGARGARDAAVRGSATGGADADPAERLAAALGDLRAIGAVREIR